MIASGCKTAAEAVTRTTTVAAAARTETQKATKTGTVETMDVTSIAGAGIVVGWLVGKI